MKRRGGLGFLPRPDSAEERFVRELDVRNKIVYDVGAFEGLFTLRFAREARQVITFEPHPWCQQTTQRNVALNRLQNVTILPIALSAETGVLTFSCPTNEPARSTTDADMARHLESQGYKLAHTQVLCLQLDEAMRMFKLPVPDLIKIDAEGAEAAILVGARQTLQKFGPALYVELHNTADQVVPLLREYGYEPERVDNLHVWCAPRQIAS